MPIRLTEKALEIDLTSQLRGVKRPRAKNQGDFTSAMTSAAYYARKMNRPIYVFKGNSYMHTVWHATEKLSKALDPINNTGNVVLTVTPDLDVLRQDRI